MKRIIALIIISFVAFSCSNNIEFNTPAFQGLKDYGKWKAEKFQAAISDSGELKIIAISTTESITILLQDFNEGTYSLGASSNNSISFDDRNFISFSTLNNGDGAIVIEEFDSTNLTISGTFKFNAYSSNGEIVNFIKGVFHKIPIATPDEEIEFVGSNSFSASVNSIDVEVGVIETDIIDSIIYVKAANTDGSYIEIFMPENITVGNHTLNFSSTTYANYGTFDGIVASSQYGTLTILEHDTQFKKIKASFLFNTGNPNNIEVSNGNFVIYY